jgi:ATP-dependent DNA helicase PIF1
MSAAIEELYYKRMSESTNTLSADQKIAWSAMTQGKNVFITGAGGVGKSKLIDMFHKTYQHSKSIGITSTTGISALLIGGTTIHSFAGIGLGQGSEEAMVMNIMKKSYLLRRWMKLQVLVLDEVSMMSPELFDKLEYVTRTIRRNERPFGGIQLILSGDFCQLPCVGCPEFCCTAKSWDKCIDEVVYMKTIIRQTDIEFQNCLNDVRMATLSPETKKFLRSCKNKELTNDFGIEPTRLFPLNQSVDFLNTQEIERLGEDGREFLEYEMEITVCPGVMNRIEATEKFLKNCIALQTLQLCVGAQVMLLFNLDLSLGLANGSRGVITKFIDDIPVVKFVNGEECLVDYHIWEIEENDKMVLSAKQIPLKLAYAMSIHKAQGVSLDYVSVDLSNVFEYGQAYVALSRVRTKEGLSITGLKYSKIRVHPGAKAFYEKY